MARSLVNHQYTITMTCLLLAIIIITSTPTTSAWVAVRTNIVPHRSRSSRPSTTTNHRRVISKDKINLHPRKTTIIMSSSASSSSSSSSTQGGAIPKTDPSRVIILPDADAVSERIKEIVVDAAREAIAERGYFALAIPGGSILKMLVNTPSYSEWAPKTTICYVNHKCVPTNDANLATHAKAQKLFLNQWQDAGLLDTIIMDGTADGPAEATSYERKMKALDDAILPRDVTTGLPKFDLALIGVGDDGHIGSLYPHRQEVLITSKNDGCPWVLPVEMKDPPSITLSLPVMANAKNVVVAACGVSEKYPQGKSEGMRRAVCEEGETLMSFPAVGLRGVATWVMDEAAGSKLGGEYGGSS